MSSVVPSDDIRTSRANAAPDARGAIHARRTTMTTVDRADLESKVRDMYRRVAERPGERYHFEMGRGLAERLGYPGDLLDRIPAAAIESFAGVGYFHDLADLRAGERVVDLGSGSGTDSFAAAVTVGSSGRVTGV